MTGMRAKATVGFAILPLALLAGCLGGEPTAPASAFAGETTAVLVSAYDDDAGFVWLGAEGTIAGLRNPNLTVASGTPLHVVVRHGGGPGDQDPHNVHIQSGDEMFADTPDLLKPGDEEALHWLPPHDGIYTYACHYHGFSQLGFILVGNVSLPEPGPEPALPVAPPPPPEPVVATLVSHLDLTAADPLKLPELPYEWVADGGEFAGQANPTFQATAGTPFVLTFRHGSDPGDLDAHEPEIVFQGQPVVQANQVASGGEAILEWTPSVPGAYTYRCRVHPGMAGSISIGLQVATLESQYDQSAGFQWKGVDGTGGGQVNPTLAGSVNGTLRIVYRHGSGLQDDQGHNLRLKDPAGDVLVEGADVAAAGDEQSVEWTFAAPGTYAYECKYHGAGQGGAISVT